METTINVKTIDGEDTTLQLQQDDAFDTPVAGLVESACETLGNSYSCSQ